MKKVVSTPIASIPEPQAGGFVDRSREMAQMMDREPGDHLTCARVFDDFYRCNWWAPEIVSGRTESIFEGLEVSTYRVRKSRFVHAQMREGRLVIEDVAPKS